MAGLALCGLLAIPAVMGAQAFSHRAHLALGLQCGGCHTRADGSTRAADNNLPVGEACSRCHEQEQRVVRPPRVTVVTHFSHQRHTAFLKDCQSCHKGMAADTPVRGMEAMAFCMTCHPKIDNPFSCEYCHDPGPHLKPASHTHDFHDRHSRKELVKEGCAACHGKRFTCQGCH
jgi:hypothetical protein